MNGDTPTTVQINAGKVRPVPHAKAAAPGTGVASPARCAMIAAATTRRAGMPEVYVYAVEGRTPEQKRGLMKDITDAVVKNFGAAPDSVTVQIVQAPKTDKAKGGVPFSER
jgi:4-oxalocrotonate tautomerase